jgi:hypothetical protein
MPRPRRLRPKDDSNSGHRMVQATVKDIAMVLLFLLPMSLGARNSKRSRSQSPGLLFRGDRQGARAPCRQDGGGAETRRAARNERKQKTAVLQGSARLLGRQAQPCPRDSEAENGNRRCLSESSCHGGRFLAGRNRLLADASTLVRDGNWRARE